jgi:hypothetical protein
VTHPVLKKGRQRTDRYAAQPERAALAALDKLSRGVFLLDLDGRVSFANRAAQRMVTRNDGLLLRRQRLQFKCAASQAALDQFLAEGAAESGESLVLCTAERAGSCTYRILVSALEHGAGYCVFVYEPNSGHRELPISVLRRLYRLTPAEAHLANELFARRRQVRAVSASTRRSTRSRASSASARSAAGRSSCCCCRSGHARCSGQSGCKEERPTRMGDAGGAAFSL